MAGTGVVDPMRVPPWLREPVERAWREAPVVARAFVILAFLDVVSRSIGILQPRSFVGIDPFGLYAMLIPHDLWILLPAVLVLRRPDAARATPLVFAGAVTIALVTAFGRPVQSWFEGPASLNALYVEIGVLESLAKLVAWLLIARGLAALSPLRPSPSTAGLSNLVLGAGLVTLLAALGRDLLNVPETGIPGLDGLLVLSNLVVYAQLSAWLYLLWIVIRGVGDSRRPAIATTAAAVGATMTGLLDDVAILAGVVMTTIQSPVLLGGGLGLEDVDYALGFLSLGVGQALIVVAFAFGLAEPAMPYVAPEPPNAPAVGAPDATTAAPADAEAPAGT
ncbi:MAG: hypothetical protein HY263_06120 [Chloroflexi bacterium]|nr:hypothetical protein [Chloroflexota bacterium]